jgi:hypothetical protein
VEIMRNADVVITSRYRSKDSDAGTASVLSMEGKPERV